MPNYVSIQVSFCLALAFTITIINNNSLKLTVSILLATERTFIKASISYMFRSGLLYDVVASISWSKLEIMLLVEQDEHNIEPGASFNYLISIDIRVIQNHLGERDKVIAYCIQRS